MITATNIHYEQPGRVRGLSAGGIGAILLMAQKIELDKEINIADGVRDVSRGFHRDAVSDRAGWTTVDLPDAVLEPVARRLPAIGRAAARVLAVLTDQSLKSGSGCPDP